MSWSLGQLSAVIANHDSKLEAILKWINNFADATKHIGIDVLKSMASDVGTMSIASSEYIRNLMKLLPSNEHGELIKSELAQDYGVLQSMSMSTQVLSYPLKIILSVPIKNIVFSSSIEEEESFETWSEQNINAEINKTKLYFDEDTYTVKFSKVEVLDAYYENLLTKSKVHVNTNSLNLNSGNVKAFLSVYNTESKAFDRLFDAGVAVSSEGQFSFSHENFEIQYDENGERIYPKMNDDNPKDETENENTTTKTENKPCVTGVINYFDSFDSLLYTDSRGLLFELQINSAVVLSESSLEDNSGQLLAKLKTYSEIYTSGNAKLYKVEQKFIEDVNRQLKYIDLHSKDPVLGQFISALNKMLGNLPGFVQHKKIGVDSNYKDYIIPAGGVWLGDIVI